MLPPDAIASLFVASMVDLAASKEWRLRVAVRKAMPVCTFDVLASCCFLSCRVSSVLLAAGCLLFAAHVLLVLLLPMLPQVVKALPSLSSCMGDASFTEKLLNIYFR